MLISVPYAHPLGYDTCVSSAKGAFFDVCTVLILTENMRDAIHMRKDECSLYFYHECIRISTVGCYGVALDRLNYRPLLQKSHIQETILC